MKRSILTTVVVLSLLAVASSAFAGHKNRNRDENNDSNNSGNFRKFSQNLGLNVPSNYGISNIVSNFKKKGHKHDDEPTPIDPGRGDGRVPVEPVTPQGPPGFVWVNGHWERERAPKVPTMIVDPLPTSGGVVVRDHRTTTSSGPIVRDHRKVTAQSGVSVFGNSITPPPVSGSIPTPTIVVRDHRVGVVRDHRTGSPAGGVTVTTSSNSPRNNSIPTLSGPGPLDAIGNGLSAAGSALGDLFSTEVGDPAPNRDHRTTTKSNFGTNVRDHR